MSKASIIADIVSKHPEKSSQQISDETGFSREYITTVIRRRGLIYSGSKGYGRELCFTVTAENYTFLQADAAKHNIKLSAAVNAIITDARIDGETQ